MKFSEKVVVCGSIGVCVLGLCLLALMCFTRVLFRKSFVPKTRMIFELGGNCGTCGIMVLISDQVAPGYAVIDVLLSSWRVVLVGLKDFRFESPTMIVSALRACWGMSQRLVPFDFWLNWT